MVATESIRLMKELAEKKQPYFLGVGFYKPHTPYVAPKKYFDLYPLEKIEVPTVPEGYSKTIPAPAKKSTQAYLATISFVDAQTGRVLDAIDASDQRENTIILFTSDHGYHMGEHGHYQKMTLFEDATKVPLIISYPEMKHRGEETASLPEGVVIKDPQEPKQK